ncbi:hypothetical protein C8J57DRAFT_1717791 [Mycena rebaudengoi]|nr:hypothetical protein C8J57DRAFT_1717791 [Mycena rebaudengoi]
MSHPASSDNSTSKHLSSLISSDDCTTPPVRLGIEENREQRSKEQMTLWGKVEEKLAGVDPIEEFLNKYLPPVGQEKIDAMLAASARALEETKTNLQDASEGNSITAPLPPQYIRNSEETGEALVQLAKSARNLLMASGSCFVFVVAVFGVKTHTKLFAQFFYGLYNPAQPGVDVHEESNLRQVVFHGCYILPTVAGSRLQRRTTRGAESVVFEHCESFLNDAPPTPPPAKPEVLKIFDGALKLSWTNDPAAKAFVPPGIEAPGRSTGIRDPR